MVASRLALARWAACSRPCSQLRKAGYQVGETYASRTLVLVGYTPRRGFWDRFRKPLTSPDQQATSPSEGEKPKSPAELERLRKQEKLKDELRRGHFWELGEVNRAKGKLFDADKELIPLEEAFKFPSFKADSLLGVEHTFDALLTMKNQVALVAISFRDSGFKALPSWIEPFQREFANIPAMQIFQVNFEDKAWLRVLKFLLVNGQRSSIERDRHGQSFQRFGSTDAIRAGLRIENRMVGYVFLVDWKGRVRWRGTGVAREEELASLLKCGHELLEECRSPESRRRVSSGRYQQRRSLLIDDSPPPSQATTAATIAPASEVPRPPEEPNLR